MFIIIRNNFILFFLVSLIVNCAPDQSTLNDSENLVYQPIGKEDPDSPSEHKKPKERTLSHPAADTNFEVLPSGKKLSSIKVKGSRLTLAKGLGTAFSSSKMDEYKKIKQDSMSDINHKIHWSFMDLDTETMIAHSANANKKIFGASSSKIYVAATLLDKQDGVYTSSQLQKLSDMLVVSSNTAWTALQKDIGGGSANKGRELNYLFTQKMGYPLTRGWQGYWNDIHGNELVTDETVLTLSDIYHNEFPGAETLWKLMYTCRTGATRGRKYIPSSIYVGGKTGTYDGPTENPETGEGYTVKMRNHILVFNIGGKQYGLAIFANNGSNESVSVLVGGLIREYTNFDFVN